MPFRGCIGDIVETGRGDGTFSCEWRIPNFLSLAGKEGDRYESPVFSACNGKWWLKIYPKGLPGLASSEWLSLYLIRLGAGLPQTLDVMLGIRGPEGVGNKRGRIQEFSGMDRSCSWNRFCSRSKFTKQNSRLMPGNMLIVSLDMKMDVPRIARVGSEKALDDFSRLLATGEKSDITVQVGEEEFKVHSLILFARCPALSVSLRHESREKASNRIVIEDCDAGVFREYLQYLYTGSAQSLTQENVFDLYRIADKYLSDDLKLQCLNHIRDTLCVQTFCDTLKLAFTYEESGLFELATNFATKNIQSIKCSAEWQKFNYEYPTQVNEVLVKSFGPQS